MSCNKLPIGNITFEVEAGYLVVFRQGPKWFIAPFSDYADAEKHADYIEKKWTSSQVIILRNN